MAPDKAVRGAARPLAVLALLAEHPGLTAKVISRVTTVPKSSTHQLLNVLRDWGFASYSPADQTWSLGPWVKDAADVAPSMADGMQVLDQFDRRRQSMSLSQLAAATGLPMSRLERVVTHLETRHYLSRSGSGDLSLGFGVVALASRVEHIERMREVARPFLFYLRDQTEETANLIIRDRDTALYIEQVESTRLLCVAGWAGRTIPLEGTATGAALTKDDSVHIQSWSDDGVTAIACRVPGSMDPPAAISVTAPNSRVDAEKLRFFTVAVSDAATGVGGQLFRRA